MQMRVTHPRRRQVVIADDDGDMRSLLAQNLRRAGIEVREATDGRHLLEIVEDLEEHALDFTPDLVVTDVHMPGTSGLEALAQLKRRWPEVPVIVITAFGDEDLHAAAERLGALMIFDKPFDLFVFRDAVVNVLGY